MNRTLQTRSVVDAVYDALRAGILGGEAAPGARVTELSVAGQFAVARPTAKAAIERLLSEGLLVRPTRGSGTTVPVFDRDDIVDLYATRTTIETAAHLTLAAIAADLAPATTHIHALDRAADANDSIGVVDADIKFHRALVSATNSPRLSRIHEMLMSEAQLCMSQVQAHQLLTARQISSEHSDIVTAIGTRDPEHITSATRDHLQRAQRKLLDRFFGEGGVNGDPTPGDIEPA